MTYNVLIDWKFVVALGAAATLTIFAVKMDAATAERVSVHALDTYKDYAVAFSDC